MKKTSKYKGVFWYKRGKKWRGRLYYNYKSICLGYFDDEEECARAYDKKAKELFGEFARGLNFPEEVESVNGVKEIRLTRGKVALVDEEDFDELNKYKWSAFKHRNTFYAVRNVRGKPLLRMHRVIMGDVKGVIYDHINGDGLDNRKSNLRIATAQQNNMNRIPRKGCSSKYKGVSWNKPNKKWLCILGHNYKNTYLGSFDDEEECARAYDKKAKELFGEFARLNFPEETIGE